jgi:hypothetical protein
MITSIGGATFNGTIFFRAGRKGAIEDKGRVNEPRHETIGLTNRGGKEGPPGPVHHILLGGFVGGAPDAPLKAGGTEQLVPVDKRVLPV